MYVTNEDKFGFLIVSDEFADNIGQGYLHPEMWEMFENKEVKSMSFKRLSYRL